MSNSKRRIIPGALVMLLLLAGNWCVSPILGITGARVMASAEPSPDLFIESITLSPDSPSIGDTLTFTVTVKNQGDAPASISQLACSIDNVNLPVVQLESLEPGAFTVKTLIIKAQAGPHLFGAVADIENSVVELIENNNDRSLAFTVLAPDLAIDVISWTPVNPAIGDTVTFTIKVINRGDKRAGISHLDFFINGSSRGPRSILGIEPGDSVDVVYIWNATAGVHNVRAAPDILGQVTESDEANNTSEAVCATKEPDLTVSSISFSPTAIPENTTVTFTVTVKNQGGSRTGPSTLTYYIDDNQQYSEFMGPLEPAATFVSTNFTWISSSKPQVFKAVVDADNRINERDETNNSMSVVFPEVFPDLTISDITWTPTSPLLHDDVSFTVTIINQGTCSSGATELKFVIDKAFFFNAVIPELPVGGTATPIINWMTQNYTHSIKATIDESNVVKESNESNNAVTKTVTSVKFTPSADLVVEKLSYLPVKPMIGEDLALTLSVKNQGTGKASPTYAGIYIDTRLIAETYINELDAGASHIKEISIPLQGLPYKDKYTLKVSANDHRTVLETNDLNNSKELTFSIIAPDLVIQNIRWSPEAPATGNKVTFDVTVKNRGDLKSGATYISYYIDQVFMGKHRIEDIEAGTTIARSFTWTVQKESFVFTAVVDEVGGSLEKDESNNLKTVRLPAPDLLIESLTWSPENPAPVAPVTFTARIKNRGYGKSPAAQIYCYYDSTAPVSLEIGEINPGDTVTTAFVYSFIPGEHILKVLIDAGDVISESDEFNNEKTVRFSALTTPPSTTPDASSNSSVKAAVKTTLPASTPTIKPSQLSSLLNKTPTPTPTKDISANLTDSPPKWQSIIQNKLFIIAFAAIGVAAIALLLILRKRAVKKAEVMSTPDA
jgi:subtilase family serine protease